MLVSLWILTAVLTTMPIRKSKLKYRAPRFHKILGKDARLLYSQKSCFYPCLKQGLVIWIVVSIQYIIGRLTARYREVENYRDWVSEWQYRTGIQQARGLSLMWRHNGHHGVTNHQPRDCFLNRLFGRSLNKKSKLRVTGLCEGNSPVTGEFPAQRASNAENGTCAVRFIP